MRSPQTKDGLAIGGAGGSGQDVICSRSVIKFAGWTLIGGRLLASAHRSSGGVSGGGEGGLLCGGRFIGGGMELGRVLVLLFAG